MEKVGHKGKHKIAGVREEEPYTVLEKPLPDIPVFKVMGEDGQSRVKNLHRNQLLPFFCFPREMDDAAVDSVEEESTESSEGAEMVPERENRESYSSSSGSDGNKKKRLKCRSLPTGLHSEENQEMPVYVLVVSRVYQKVKVNPQLGWLLVSGLFKKRP